MSGRPQAWSRLASTLQAVPLGDWPGLLARGVGARARRGLVAGLARSGLHRRLPAGLAGRGVVLLFHEVHADVGRELMVGCEIRHVLNAVRFCREDGRDIVDPAEALRRLGDPKARRFAVLTFDDGYRDIRLSVLPALEAERAPFTVFVPSAAVTRDLNAWWLGLRRLVQARDTVTIAPMDRRFATGTWAEKVLALRALTGWVTADLARAGHAAEIVRAHGISVPDLVDRALMSGAELREVASHPLVTIGAHTESHAALSLLSPEDARGELSRNRAFLEALLQRSVDHVAYPYGGPGACGPREAAITRDLGFLSGVTTRSGTLQAADAGSAHLLPREDVGYPGQNAATLMAHCYGLRSLLP